MGALIDRAIGAAYRLMWRAGWWIGHRQRQAGVRVDPSLRLPSINREVSP